MPITIIDNFISIADLKDLAKDRFGDMVKAVVDIRKKIMAAGGELHADEEAMLLEDGSKQDDLWGINIYVYESRESWIEFDSMINLRPSQYNNSRSIENLEVRNKVIQIVNQLIK